jgi:hypothetical protein
VQARKALTGSTIPAGTARALIGASVLVKPTLLASTLGVDATTAERTAWIARFFAGRDFALGVGVAAGSRGCQVAACASDVGDLVAVALALRGGHVRALPGLLTAATAAGAAVTGAATLLVTRG